MPVYAKKTLASDPRFSGRVVSIIGQGSRDDIPVPDSVVLCNGCNSNVAEDTGEAAGYLVYLSKRELAADQPYDFYCRICTQRHFPKAVYS